MSSQNVDTTVYPQDIQCILDSKNGKGGIFISNVEAASNPLTLMKLNIKAVLTAASNINLTHSKTDVPYYKKVPGLDHQGFDLSQYFDESVDFIENALKTTNILVHCMAGVSRSVSLVLAYFIKNRGMTYDDAYKLVKSRRKIIYPNDGFIKQLKQYEKANLLKKKLLKEQKYESPSKYSSIEISKQFSSILRKYQSPSKTLTPTKYETTKMQYRNSVSPYYVSPLRTTAKNYTTYQSPSRQTNTSPLKPFNQLTSSPRKTIQTHIAKKFSYNEKSHSNQQQIQQRINNIRKKYSHLDSALKTKNFCGKQDFYQTTKYNDMKSYYESPSKLNNRKQKAYYDKY